MIPRALLIAAPSSGAGKTTLTLGLLRALKDAGLPITGAKSGPDYIDPKFHEAATGLPCLNLDAWAMSPTRLGAIAHEAAAHGTLLIEGAMGLFDGAPPAGKGASADVARILNIPVLLVVDAAKTAQSVAPLVAGFAHFAPEVRIAGVLLNNVGSPRHEKMLRVALAPLNIPVLGAIPRSTDLARPSRHLGLVQAGEHPDLEAFLQRTAEIMAQHADLAAIHALAAPLPAVPAGNSASKLPPPAQRIAVAKDRAFAFSYPHMLKDWRAAGAEITFFSPLENTTVPASDFIFLPGGYPELHAATLASANNFKTSLRRAAQAGTEIYGECGGYMTLGTGMVDAAGLRHEMLGLLPLETSFEQRKLHLGYRDLCATQGPWLGASKAHEFHYASTLCAKGQPLFSAQDAEGTPLPAMGLIAQNVSGSFAHIIDKV